MKFESKQSYIASFKTKITTVGGRLAAELEINDDIKKLYTLLPKVNASIAKRNAATVKLTSEKRSLTEDRKNYVLTSVLGILKPSVSKRVKAIDAELELLAAKRSRLLGNELQLDDCRVLLNDLLKASSTVLSQITQQQYKYERNKAIDIDIRAAKRAEKQEEKERKLAPYAKRIALGEAAMGKTRAVASVRKRKLKKSADCPYCGKPFGADAGVADHIYPVARGGLSVHENMVFVCTPCNQKKSDRTLHEYIYKYQLDMIVIHTRLSKLGKRY